MALDFESWKEIEKYYFLVMSSGNLFCLIIRASKKNRGEVAAENIFQYFFLNS